MSTTETFDKWYSQIRGLVTGGDLGQKGEKVESCVRQLKQEGHDEQSAFAICEASMKAELTEEGRAEALEIAEDVKGEEESIGDAFERVVHAAGLYADEEREEEEEEEEEDEKEEQDEADQKGEFEGYHLGTDGDPGEGDDVHAFFDALVDAGADVWQVRNGELFVWPDDDFPIHDPAINVIGIPGDEFDELLEAHEVEFMSVTEGVVSKADQGPETRRVWLDHGAETAPDDVDVKQAEEGLYYEVDVSDPR